MSTLRVNAIQNASGGDLVNSRGIAKAWVNFNGTGTVAIRASYNVTSITDNGVGDYTINFTTAMTDGNYSCALSSFISTAGDLGYNLNGATTNLAGSCRTLYQQSSGPGRDIDLLTATFFR